MKTNNTVINSIMKKYICAVAMLLGMSVSAWGAEIYYVTTQNCTTSLTEGTYSAGSTVTFTVTPENGYYCPSSIVGSYDYGVYHWEDSKVAITCTGKNTYSFTMPNRNDVWVFIVCKAATSHSVTYHTPSCVDGGSVTQSGTLFRTPSTSDLATYLSSYKFEGWITSSSYSSTTAPSFIYKPGEGIPDGITEVYAVFTGISSAFSKVSSTTISDGADYMLFLTDNATNSASNRPALNNVVDSKNRMSGNSFSVTKSVTTCTDWSCIWTFEQGTGTYSSYWFIYNKQLGKYLGVTGKGDPGSNDRCMQLRANKDAYTAWSAVVSSGQVSLTNKYRNDQSCTYKKLVVSGDNAGIFNATNNLYLFGQGSTTITYTTSPTGCPSTSFTVTYAGNGADGGTLPTDANEYKSGDWVDVAENTLTKTGYEFAGWLSSYNGYTYDGDGTDGFYMGDEDVTLTAQWTAATTTITLNKNCASGTNGSATVKYNATALATKTDATNSAIGYHLEGYYTNDATPVKILSSTGAFANSTISGYVTSGKWSYTTASTLTLYAHWELNTHSLHWYKNDEGADDLTGSYTEGNDIEYGTTITTPNTPTFTGHTFEGWSTSSSGSTADPATSMPDNDLTYYAIWSLNHHKLSVAASIANITVTATPSGGSAIAEGSSNASVDYGKSVTLSGTSITAGYAFNHWLVTKDEDGSDVTESCVVGNTLTMPDYDVTVTAVMYAKAKLKTRCLQFEVTGDIYLTSTAANEVYTDIAADQITITCEDWGDADKISVTYLNGSGETVAKASSLFRVCDASTFNYVDATYDYITISSATSHASGVKYAISYKPGASEYDQLDTWTIRFTAKQSSTTLGHKDLVVHGRALPDKFVVAAKIGGQWCALPADLATSSGTAVQDAYPIQVDNMTTPTTAIAPKTAIYFGATRNNSAQHRGGVRLQTQVGDSKDGYLQAPRSNSLTYLWRASTNSSKGMQDWYLKSSDFGTYNIALDPSIVVTSGSGDGESEGDGSDPLSRYLCVYSNKIYWGATGAKDFRILPVTEFTPVDVQVVEWASDKIRFMYLGNPDYEAEVKIDNVTKASAAELSTLKIDEGVYEIAVSDLMSSGYKIMHIIIKNGGTEVGRQAVNVPLLVNSTTTVATAAAGFTKGTQCPRMDLVVLSGGKLTAEDATAYQFKSTTVYGGGKLIIDDSKGLNAGTMYLRAGSVNVATKGATPSTSYIYTYPQVYIGSGATLTVSGNIINFDYLTNYDQYFGLALPYPVTLATGIGYPADIYGSAKAGSFLLRTFDSKIRAAQGAVDAVWADIEETNTGSGGSITAQTATTRGLGYYLLSPPRKMSINGGDAVRQKYGIQRLKMDVSSMAENSNASISVTAYPSAQPYNAGWWLLGNPYMANLGGAGVTGTSITVGYLGADASGNAEWKDKSVRYVTVPNDDASETYNQQTVESYTFPAFKPFYVQVGATGTVTFATANRAAAAPKRFTQDGIPAEIATAVALNSTAYGDTTHILIGNVFSDEYEVGDDLMKMPHANVSLFTISNGTDLFSNALNSQSALAGIPVGYTAPGSSRYVFSHVPKADDAWIEHIWLKDKELGLQKDLLEGSYEFDSEASSNKSRFELVIELRTSPSVTTDIENAGEENITQPMKFIWHDQLYILRNGKLYDATGKRVKEINK